MTAVDSTPDGVPASWLHQARPRLGREVRIGPLLTKGGSHVHIVGDQRTQSFVKVGPREAFLMRRLDGDHSLAEISTAYADQFGKRLAEQHWQQLLGLLHARAMIEPADEAKLAEVRERAEEARRAEGRSPLLWRVPMPGVADLVPQAARRFGWLLHPLAAVPLAVAGALTSIFVLLNWPAHYDALATAPNRLTVSIIAFVITWLVIGAHEFGHGVACHRFGGRPTQIGLMWRFPLITPFCKVDDVVTFERRAHRVMTSFAGIYVNLIALVPFAGLWWWGPQSGWWHGLAGLLLLLGTAAVLGNLVPVFKLDGYHMLEHATSTMNLQSESFRFAGAMLRHGRAGVREYDFRTRCIYSAYFLITVAVIGSALFLLVRLWYLTLADFWSPAGAALFLAVEAVVVAAFLRWAVNWRRRKSKEG